MGEQQHILSKNGEHVIVTMNVWGARKILYEFGGD